MRRWLVEVLVSACAVVLTLGVLSPPRAHAGAPHKRDAAEEAAALGDLGAVDASLAKAFRDGTAALDAQRYPEARADFEAILARAPRHAATLRRLSYVALEQGNVDEAIALARRSREASPGRYGDYALASALLAKKGDSSAEYEAGELGDHLLDGSPPPNEEIATMAGSIALARKNIASLGRAVAVLEQVAPSALATNYLAAILDATKGDVDASDAALTRAQAAGLPADVAAKFREESGIDKRHRLWRLARGAGLGLGLWLLGFAAIFLVGSVMSSRALSAVERLSPDRSNALVESTLRLRRAYAAAIAFAAVYYYLSIPIVIVLVVGLGGLAIYGMMLAGWIAFKLLAIVIIGGLVTVSALIRSLFIKRGAERDPGARLDEAEAPDLWAVLREVAAQVGTRPVDQVFVTPGTEVGVFERGTMSERVRDRGRRHLVLGVAVLDGLTERQLRAALAHEYGHFSHRDTARGDLAGTVRASLLAAVVRLARGGGASVFNPAWHFLRLYLALFQRVALGASRLQEALADRFAAASYGGPALVEGLRHIVRRSVEFEAEAAAAVTRAQGERRAIASLYVAPSSGAVNAVDVQKALTKAMTDPGSPYDSHPPIAKRIAWLTAFGDATSDVRAVTSDGPAWDLLNDRASLEARMTALVNDRLEAAGHIDVPAPSGFASPVDLRPDPGP